MKENSAIEPILLVDLSEGFGGVDTRVIETARGLHGQFEYSVATLKDSPLHQRLEAAGLNATPLPYSKYDPRNLWAMLKVIRQGEYQVVDAHNDQSWLWGLLAARMANVPVKVSSVQLPCRITPGGIRGWVQEQILHLNRRWGCRFMTVNKLLIDYLMELGVPKEQIALIYNTIELETYEANQPAVPIRELVGWPDDSVIFVTIARLVPQKAHDILLQSVRQAAVTRPNIRCLIVGEGKLEAKLKEQANELGISDFVYFMGFRSDIPAVLNGCDVFCLPSRSEGLPFALLEACAHKMPILVSDVDGMGELFSHMETAYMVPPENVGALAAGLVWHTDSLSEAKEIGQSGFEFVKERLSPQVMVNETLAFYSM